MPTYPHRQPLNRPTIGKLLWLFLVGLLLLAPLNQTSAAPQSPLAAISLGSSYTQNFDSLSSSGTSNSWTDDSTIAGWYSTQTTYRASSGTSTAGALYSFGTDASDRALGSIASGTYDPICYGARFTNDTGSAVTSLAVSYTGEQWRDGTQTTAQTLDFSYQISATVIITAGTWTDVDSLDFTTPTTTGSGAPLDGNVSANRTTLNDVIAVNIPAGQEIMIRWCDSDDTGFDHGLSIDDLTVTDEALAVTLATFTAETTADSEVLLRWESVLELDNLGFNLYRSTTPDELPSTPLNPHLIPSQAPGSGQGATYEFIDRTIEPAITYYYWLEDVEINGSKALHGPISVVTAQTTQITLKTLTARLEPSEGHLAIVSLIVLGSLLLLRRVMREERCVRSEE